MNKYEKEMAQSELNNEKAVLKKLKQNYRESLDEINEKLEVLLARQDSDLSHVIYQVDYQRALKKQVEAILDTLQNNEFETISEYLTQSYDEGFMGTLYALQEQGVPFAFPINQEMVVAAIQHETMLTSSLYVALGKEIKNLQKEIAAEISRGVTNQMGYSDIARNIANKSQIPMNKAMTIARTEAHRIRETAASHVQDKAVRAGADVVKIWDATLDSKTRSHHIQLDGQIREVNKPFEVAGLKAMYPGQFGRPEEDINCRCRSRCEARWALNDGDTKMLGNVSKMDDKRKQEIADKLGIPVYELEQYSDQIVPIKAKNYEDFKQQYNKLWRYDDSVRSNVQKISEKRSTAEGVFDTFNNTKADSIRPHSVMKDMKNTEVGTKTLEYLESENVPVHLCYGVDNPNDDFGIYDPVDDEITVFCDKTKTIKETTGTVIHEAKHRMMGNKRTKAEEIECYKAEVLHLKGELTQNDIDVIIKLVKENYPDLD